MLCCISSMFLSIILKYYTNYEISNQIENLCYKKPCIDQGTCIFNRKDKTFVCLCGANFEGRSCEKGESSKK